MDLQALIANVNRDPKKSRVFRPADFSPFATRRRNTGIAITADNIGILKGAFVDKHTSG